MQMQSNEKKPLTYFIFDDFCAFLSICGRSLENGHFRWKKILFFRNGNELRIFLARQKFGTFKDPALTTTFVFATKLFPRNHSKIFEKFF